MAESELVLLRQYARTRDAFAFRQLVEQHQDELIRILNHPGRRFSETRTVVRYLGRFGTPEAQAACLAKIESAPNSTVRRKFTTAMLSMAPPQGIAGVREEMFADLAKDGPTRRNAALALAKTYDPRLVPVLVEIIGTDDKTLKTDGDTSRMARWTAIHTLGRIGNPEAEKVLIALVKGKGARAPRSFLARAASSQPGRLNR